MKNIKFSLLLCMTVFLTAFPQLSRSQKMSYKLYHNAWVNNNSGEYWVCVEVQNMNTGEKKSICSRRFWLKTAIQHEMNCDMPTAQKIAIANEKMLFQFKNKEALKAIAFYKTNDEEMVKTVNNKIENDSLINKVKRGEIKELCFPDSIRNEIMGLYYAERLISENILVHCKTLTTNCILFDYIDEK